MRQAGEHFLASRRSNPADSPTFGPRLPTEQISPRYVDLDSRSTAEMIAAMYEGQLVAAAAVRSRI